ncbi:MAG: hypothetical protein ACREUU_04825 [Gammaproteobacteria bacterium]
MLGLGDDPENRFMRRVDDGALTGELIPRYEPEARFSNNELPIYYSAAATTNGELLRLAPG